MHSNPRPLYHMTLASNLPSIFKYGLHTRNSMALATSFNNLADPNVVHTRSNLLDKVNNLPLHDYVPLYFNPRNPMLYRRKEVQDQIVFLEINREVLDFTGRTVFTDGNAASPATTFYPGGIGCVENLKLLNWACIDADSWNNIPDGKRIKCAEVLVLGHVDINLITGLSVRNHNLQVQLQWVARTKPVKVQPLLFF